MADDWIKMRTDIYRDPKVSVMADILSAPGGSLGSFVSQNMQRDMCVTRNVTRNAVIGALVSVWGVARQRGTRRGDDLCIEFQTTFTVEVIDDLADLPGFGLAMLGCGWLLETTKGLVFPRFFSKHNVDPDDYKREQDAARQRARRERDKQRDKSVTNSVTRHAKVAVEKRRVEKSNTPPPTPAANPSAPAPEVLEPEWEAVAADLSGEGMGDARAACLGARAGGALPYEVRHELDHWRSHPGAWTIGLLYGIVKRMRGGQKVSWPEPANGYNAAAKAEENKRKVADQLQRRKEGELRREKSKAELAGVSLAAELKALDGV